MPNVAQLLQDLADQGVTFQVLGEGGDDPFICWWYPPGIRRPTLPEQDLLLRHPQEALQIVEGMV